MLVPCRRTFASPPIKYIIPVLNKYSGVHEKNTYNSSLGKYRLSRSSFLRRVATAERARQCINTNSENTSKCMIVGFSTANHARGPLLIYNTIFPHRTSRFTPSFVAFWAARGLKCSCRHLPRSMPCIFIADRVEHSRSLPTIIGIFFLTFSRFPRRKKKTTTKRTSTYLIWPERLQSPRQITVLWCVSSSSPGSAI